MIVDFWRFVSNLAAHSSCAMNNFEHTISFKVIDERGLHVRPCEKIVSLAYQIHAMGLEICLNAKNQNVDPKSMLNLIGLGMECNDDFRLTLRSSTKIPEGHFEEARSKFCKGIEKIAVVVS